MVMNTIKRIAMVGERKGGGCKLTALQEPPGRHIETHGAGVDGIGNRASLSKQKDGARIGGTRRTTDGTGTVVVGPGWTRCSEEKWNKILDGKFRFPRLFAGCGNNGLCAARMNGGSSSACSCSSEESPTFKAQGPRGEDPSSSLGNCESRASTSSQHQPPNFLPSVMILASGLWISHKHSLLPYHKCPLMAVLSSSSSPSPREMSENTIVWPELLFLSMHGHDQLLPLRDTRRKMLLPAIMMASQEVCHIHKS